MKNKITQLFFTLLLFASHQAISQSVNLSFPSGIDNCLSPVPNGGTYTLAGTLNGKNYYTKGANLRIIWTGSQWEVQGDDPAISGVSWITGWFNTSNTSTPPADCWQASFGCFGIVLSGSDAFPSISSITIAKSVTANLAAQGNVDFTVTFSGAVSGVSTSNFQLVTTGSLTGGTVLSVTPVNSTTYTVTVYSGSGDGTVGLNMVNSTGISAAVCATFPVTSSTYTINNTSSPITLSAGDIVFTGYNSSSTTSDNFSFVVLRSGGLPSGTKIFFTDNGYGPVDGGLRPGEGVVLWTATSAIAQYTQVTITCNISPVSHSATSGSVTSLFTTGINLSSTGDQVLAYQGSMVTPTFISGIHMNSETGTGTTTFSSTLAGWDDMINGTSPFTISAVRSALPPGLTNGTNAIMGVTGTSAPYTELDNGVYNCTGATLAASDAALKSAICNRANWSLRDATVYSIPPSCTFSVGVAASINVTGSLAAFSSCTNSASNAQSFSVSGVGLTTNILVSAPTGFEVSLSSSSGYASSVTLTQSGGSVSSTTIYVRLSSAATGSPSGNIACSTTGATTQNVSASGVVNTSTTSSTTLSACVSYTWNGVTYTSSGTYNKTFTGGNSKGCDSTATLNLTINNSVAGSVSSNQSICLNSSASNIQLTGSTGTIQWQSSNNNATFTNISGANSSTLSSASIGSLTATSYFRAIVTNGTCSPDTSATVTITVNPCNNNDLSNLTISSGTLNPSFTSPTTAYAVSVANTVSSVTVTPTLSDANATMQIRVNSGTYVSIANGATSSSLSLNVGNNTIDVKVTAQNGTSIKTYTITVNRGVAQIVVNFKAILQGLYIGSGNMTAAPYNFNTFYPQTIADTIMVELHASASPYTMVYSTTTTLGITGLASVNFPGAANGNSYYIVIKHRNSIETWSANPISMSPTTSYDFSNDITKAFGSNMIDDGTGLFMILTGDINQDGSIDFNDYPNLDIASSNGILGYDVNDLNGDASVDFNDYPLIDVNSSNGVILMRP